jgi:hypothetical protein
MKFRREIYKILLFSNEEELSEKNELKNNQKNFIPFLQYFKNVWINKERYFIKKLFIRRKLQRINKFSHIKRWFFNYEIQTRNLQNFIIL